MKSDELERLCRAYETDARYQIPTGMEIVARLDGRGFSRLTKELMEYEKPFDTRFRDALVATMKHLMGCGFNVRLAYGQSDEISLLLDPDETIFGRRAEKWLSVLAGEASAALSLAIGRHAVMDCRIIPLPCREAALDYFRWRMQDAERNCLSAHAYWLFRKAGKPAAEATALVNGLSRQHQVQLLRANGQSHEMLPPWQRRGYAVVHDTTTRTGHNPLTGQSETVERNVLREILELPTGDAFSGWLQGTPAGQDPLHQCEPGCPEFS
jgi:tRNA(His) 5'-end guanylyltransferase